jgi:hypothetical protein
MGDRIERFREKQLDWLDLTLEERDRVRLLDRIVEETRRVVDVTPPDGLTAGVMSRIEGLQPRPSGAPDSDAGPLWRFLFARRRVVVEFRVAQLLASAAVLLLVVAGARWTVPSPAGSDAAAAPVFVQFRLHAPGATSVQLAGSFSEWRVDHALHEAAQGVWVVTVPLESGIHDYSFLVDGARWVVDPYAPAIDDGFGGAANRLSLLAPERRS